MDLKFLLTSYLMQLICKTKVVNNNQHQKIEWFDKDLRIMKNNLHFIKEYEKCHLSEDNKAE